MSGCLEVYSAKSHQTVRHDEKRKLLNKNNNYNNKIKRKNRLIYKVAIKVEAK